jgi:hypothetical protein
LFFTKNFWACVNFLTYDGINFNSFTTLTKRQGKRRFSKTNGIFPITQGKMIILSFSVFSTRVDKHAKNHRFVNGSWIKLPLLILNE